MRRAGTRVARTAPWVRQPFVTVTLRALDRPRGLDILDGGLVSAFVSAFASVYVQRVASLGRGPHACSASSAPSFPDSQLDDPTRPPRTVHRTGSRPRRRAAHGIPGGRPGGPAARRSDTGGPDHVGPG